MYCLDEVFEYEKCAVKVLLCTPELRDFVPKHWHRNLELNYIVSGLWQVELSYEKWTAGPGELICINSQEEHLLTPVDPQTGKKITVIFDTFLTEDCHFNVDTQKICIDDKIHDPARIKALMTQLFDIYNQRLEDDQIKNIYFFPDSYRYLQITGIAYDLLYELLQYYVQPKEQKKMKNSSAQKKMTAAENYIAAHYMENISLADIADELGITGEHCTRLFKKWTNYTFKEYLSRARILRAYPLLRDTDKSIKEISEMTGFPNVRSFSKSALEVFRVSPGELRNSLQNINILHEPRE